MNEKVLVSTAYLPPVDYYSILTRYDEVLIEKEENYIKQTFRNRCYILSSNGTQMLSVPVLQGSFHKTPIKEIRIDYSKRWQQIHLGALNAAYKSSPYFEYYYDLIEQIISANHSFLLDLNQKLTLSILKTLNVTVKIDFTTYFESVGTSRLDYRYSLAPKIWQNVENKQYVQVFSNRFGFVPGLSIVDLLFNAGPDSSKYL